MNILYKYIILENRYPGTLSENNTVSNSFCKHVCCSRDSVISRLSLWALLTIISHV